jgi:hypothetical protein
MTTALEQIIGSELTYIGSKRDTLSEHSGLKGKTFTILKFMTQENPETDKKLIYVEAQEKLSSTVLNLVVSVYEKGKKLPYTEVELKNSIPTETLPDKSDIELAEEFTKTVVRKKERKELIQNVMPQVIYSAPEADTQEVGLPPVEVSSELGFSTESKGIALGFSNQVLANFFQGSGAVAYSSFEQALASESLESILNKGEFIGLVQDGLYLLEGGLYNYIREKGLYTKIKSKEGYNYTSFKHFHSDNKDTLFKGKEYSLIQKKEQAYNICKEKGWSFKDIQDNKIKFTRLLAINEVKEYEVDTKLTEMLFDPTITTKDIKAKAASYRETVNKGLPAETVQGYKSLTLKFTEEDFPLFLNIINQINYLSAPEERILPDEDIISLDTIANISKVGLATFITQVMGAFIVLKADVGGPDGLLPEDMAALMEHRYNNDYSFKVTKKRKLN